MKNLKSVFWFVLLGISNVVLAQRYDMEESYGSSVDPVLNFILSVGGTIAAYWYLGLSYSEWYQRKQMTSDERANVVKENLFLAIIGYLIVAVFLSIPIFFVIKLIGGYELFVQTRFFVWAATFSVLTYLRRT